MRTHPPVTFTIERAEMPETADPFMTSGRRFSFSNPVFLLALAAALIAFVVQSGELGSADMHRLQSTHSFWTS